MGVRGEAEPVGVFGQLPKADRSGVGDQQPQDAVTLRQWPGSLDFLVGHANGYELGQRCTGGVEYPQAP